MTRVALMFGNGAFDIPMIQASLPKCEVEHFPDWKQWESSRLEDTCRDFEVIVTSRSSPKLPDSLVGNRGRLQLLAHCHGTVRPYVSKALIEDGLLVSNWGDAVAGVAESALCLVLACLKQLNTLDRFVRNDWKGDERIWQHFSASLFGRAVGIYGFGPIGRHFASMLAPFNSDIFIYDPYAQDVPAHIRVCDSLEDLFSRVQVVSIHCGLNDVTRGSVNKHLLSLLPQGGVVVNTARGPIIVEEDLAAELKAGRLVAGVDVIKNERGWASSPLAETNCYLTGHVLTSGKGRPPEEREPRNLPTFVLHNLQALSEHGEDTSRLVNIVTAEEYDLKT